jgi:hypothetical protein
MGCIALLCSLPLLCPSKLFGLRTFSCQCHSCISDPLLLVLVLVLLLLLLLFILQATTLCECLESR